MTDLTPSTTVRTVAELRAALQPAREAGDSIALVATMGALHEGHLSLIEAAARRCAVVVVSIFVNPIQFDEQADLAAYPRGERRDVELAAGAGAHLIFAPAPQEIYPSGFSTAVRVSGLTDRLEGAARGAQHFHGVTTVVCKLLNIVAPHVAFFGAKDAQQVAVVRRMVADLDIPARIETVPTVREPDGLAASSRNARLTPQQRRRALCLHAALRAAERELAGGQRDAALLLAIAGEQLARAGVEPEYLALVDGETFEEVDRLQRDGLLLVAARFGDVRLIDNMPLHVAAGPTPGSRPEEEPSPHRPPAEPDSHRSSGQPDHHRSPAEPSHHRSPGEPDPRYEKTGEVLRLCNA